MKQESRNITWAELSENIMEYSECQKKLESSRLVLFGAGDLGKMAYNTICTHTTVYALADNNPELWGKELEKYGGLQVLNPEDLKQEKNIFVIIIAHASHYKAIKCQLDAMQIEHMTYMEYTLSRNYEYLKQVYDELLEDEESKRTYATLLFSYVKNDVTYVKDIFVRNQYFEIPEFCIPSSREVFVDCGAFVGDTAESFISIQGGIVKQIYAFEPSDKNSHALTIRSKRLQAEWALEEGAIIVEKKGIGAKHELRYFMENAGQNSSNRVTDKKTDGERCVEIVSLDEYFKDKEDKPTFIKADIEGSELDMIMGAENLIKEYKPRLAICIYHKADDLYEIPLLIKKLNPQYKMAVRHHTPCYFETVLYCY